MFQDIDFLGYENIRSNTHELAEPIRAHKRRLTDICHTKSSKLISPSKSSKIRSQRKSINLNLEPVFEELTHLQTTRAKPQPSLCNNPSKPEKSKLELLKHKHTSSESISNKILPFTSRSRHSLDFKFNQSPSKQQKQESISPIKPEVFRNKTNSPKHQISAPIILSKPGTEVLNYVIHKLSDFEKSELIEYAHVYFIGNILKRESLEGIQTVNDDEKGNLVLGKGDHIAYRFEVVEKLGSGSFGQVFKVIDHKFNTLKALKVITNRPRFKDQALIEIKILKYLKKLDGTDSYSIVHIEDYFSYRNHICITFELLSCSLYEFMKKNSFKGLSNSLLRRFASQLLHALLLLSNHNIIHCDLKPENILLKTQNRSIVKVIDFGSSCFGHERIFDYLQSRYYRAPEIVLGVSYSTAIDIWSFGCILAELFIGRPLLPAENEADLLMRISEIIGNPPEGLLRKAKRTNEFWVGRIWRAKEKVKFRRPLARTIDSILNGADDLFIDLIKRCLKWEPSERLTPTLALSHPWIAQ